MNNPLKAVGHVVSDAAHAIGDKGGDIAALVVRKVKIELYEETVMDALGRLRQLNPDKAGTYDTCIEMMKTAGA